MSRVTQTSNAVLASQYCTLTSLICLSQKRRSKSFLILFSNGITIRMNESLFSFSLASGISIRSFKNSEYLLHKNLLYIDVQMIVRIKKKP